MPASLFVYASTEQNKIGGRRDLPQFPQFFYHLSSMESGMIDTLKNLLQEFKRDSPATSISVVYLFRKPIIF